MSRPIERGEVMNESLRVRCTLSDKQRLAELARKKGTNVSTFLRLHFIEQGLIEA